MRVRLLPWLWLFPALACGGDDGEGGDLDAGPLANPMVSELVDATCSTEAVRGLSLQIAAEIACVEPDALVPFVATGGVVFQSGAVLPFLAPEAVTDLHDAVAEAGDALTVTSGFRTVVQQYLLYQWSLSGRCGVAIAAVPGNSNHESGRAIDVLDYSDWISDLQPYGWEQTVPGDPVHFDHLPSPDRRGLDVEAFQRLWNRNHPGDPIDEDGVYGSQTEARIETSPSLGFEIGPECETSARWDAAVEGWRTLPPAASPPVHAH